MIVISNTSPVINLAAIEKLDLLNQLYGKIIIPQGVYHEVKGTGADQAGATEIDDLEWIEVTSVPNQDLVQAVRMELDQGESEAIALAIQMKANLLLIDERRGRAVAKRFGLRYIGVLGIIVGAKHKGLIQAVTPLLDDLIARAGFWVSKNLYNRVVQVSGEKDSE
ncbi:MAG: DUF3368 domain-containing protein [bacterium]